MKKMIALRSMTHDAGRWIGLAWTARVPVLAMALGSFAVAALPPASSARAASYYVDSANGSDSNNGSIASPFQTIDYGVTKIASGDVLYVRAGTYHATFADKSCCGGIVVAKGNDGAPSALKTVKAYPGETPILADEVVQAGNYWRWEGLFFNAVGQGFNVRPTGDWASMPIPAGNTAPMAHETPGLWPHDIQIVGNTFKGVIDGWAGFIHAWASNLLIENNDLTQLIATSGVPGSAGIHTSAIYVSAGDNITIRGNVITGPGDYIVQVYDERRASGEVYTRWITNVVVEGNTLYNPPNGHVAADGLTYFGKGLELGTGTATQGFNVVIRNNIVYNVGQAGMQVDAGYTNVKVLNNTIFQPIQGAPCYNERWGTGTIVENNIFDLGASSTSSHVWAQQPFTLTNNLYWPLPIKYSFSATTDSNPIQGDPMFVNASTDPTLANFHLQSGSAAIDKGLTLAVDVLGDKDGVCRPQGAAFDIGAYEFCASGSCPATCGSGSGTIVNALSPAPPRGFHLQ